MMRDPVMRALAIFLAGMALLLAIDLASEPRGRIGQDRAIDSALSRGNTALTDVARAPDGAETPEAAERRERAQSATFFLEQASLAWRRGDGTPPDRLAAARGGTSALAFLGKLWALGWLLLPLGMFAARLSCPRIEGRHPHWALLYGASALGGSGGIIALTVAIHALGAPSQLVLAPLVSAIVVLNAWLLSKYARTDRAATLLRLAPILVILTVALMLGREMLLSLAILP
tara:strand:- start:377 stop:1069 length:693 start_codon:yes stop_codon:yes gene_type:complete